MGFKQKIPQKITQMYIQKDFDIVQPSFLIYLGFSRFWAFGVFSLPCMGLRLICASKMFKSR